MNHLCNSHCELCGVNIVEEYSSWDPHEEGAPYTFFSLLLVATNFELPLVLDYGFQTDFSCSVCNECAHRLLASDRSTYTWHKCHCCGLDTQKEDFTAFRLVEVIPDAVEQHPFKGDPYEFLSADTVIDKGPVGHTVCMSCVLPELTVGARSGNGEEMMLRVVEDGIKEGDVDEMYSEDVA